MKFIPSPTRSPVRIASPLGMSHSAAEIKADKAEAFRLKGEQAYNTEFERRLNVERTHYVEVMKMDPVKVDGLVGEILELPRPITQPNPNEIEEMGAAVYAMREVAWQIHQEMHAE